ncbi:MAG: hypothetical protein R8G33_07945 [Gammaproteobacteria bacterium]|nr:hypothetical protein [Gammaproteobacteria bacterium]
MIDVVIVQFSPEFFIKSFFPIHYIMRSARLIKFLLLFVVFASLIEATHAELIKIRDITDAVTIDAPQVLDVGYQYNALLNGMPYSKTMTSISSKGLTWIGNNGCISTYLVQFAIPVKWVRCQPYEDGTAKLTFGGAIWPLFVGKEFFITADLGYFNLRRNCKVESAQRVKTGMGEFDTLKVVCKDTSNLLVWYLSLSDGQTVYHEHSNSHYNFFNIYETVE